MEKSIHNNLIAFYPEVNSIWKSPQQATPKFSIDFSVKQWISWNLTGTGIEHPNEFITEPGSLLFVPGIAYNNIFLHFRKKA